MDGQRLEITAIEKDSNPLDTTIIETSVPIEAHSRTSRLYRKL